MASTYYHGNRLLDHTVGKTAYPMPTSLYLAMFGISGPTIGLRAASVALGQFTSPPFPSRIYCCTQAGTTAATEPTWTDADGAVVVDGAAVWTEHTPSLLLGTNIPEASFAGYARIAVSPSMWAAATGNQASVTADLLFARTNNVVVYTAGLGLFDDPSAGNLREFVLTGGVTVAPSDTPSPSGLTVSYGAFTRLAL